MLRHAKATVPGAEVTSVGVEVGVRRFEIAAGNLRAASRADQVASR